MSDKAEIKKVVLQLDDKEIELSVEQAKKLKSLLNELFGKEKETIFIDRYVPNPYPVYPQPYYWRWDSQIYSAGATGATGGTMGFNQANGVVNMDLK